jgi:hypothetical protein
LHGSITDERMFLISSKEGEFFFVGHGKPGWPQWRIVSYAINDELSFPSGPVDQYVNHLGFGMMRDPHYFVMRTRRKMPDGSEIRVFGAASATYHGWGLIVPHWFVLLIAGSLLTFIALGRRFTLRAFLIWVTIVCLILGVAMRSSSVTVSH